jgi:predicted flavoprotein YhiN
MSFSVSSCYQSLKLGHQALVDAIDSIQPFLRSYPQAKPRLREFQQRLLTFFSKQDDIFFHALYQFYKNDRSATKMIDFLVHDLKDLKVQFLIFFEKHSGEALDQHVHTFPKDFMDFAAQILAHIKIEEERLLPLLMKMEGV